MSDRRDEVRHRYAAAATGSGTDPCTADGRFGSCLYPAGILDGMPGGAVTLSLGCGNPHAMADLAAGDVVLDLGSGGGIDVILSARRVGPTGRAIGLDMTPEMAALARAHAAEAGVRNVEFLLGHIEAIPLPDASVDVVISNCVVNLSPDKERVAAEIVRVLRPGGRVVLSDVVVDDSPGCGSGDRGDDDASCVAGALGISAYREVLLGAGLGAVSIETTHQVGEGAWAAAIRAVAPPPASR